MPPSKKRKKNKEKKKKFQKIIDWGYHVGPTWWTNTYGMIGAQQDSKKKLEWTVHETEPYWLIQ